MKRCSRCNVDKLEAEFYKRKSGIYRNPCKICVNERSNKWHKENPESTRCTRLKFRKKNRDECRQKLAQYLLSHPCVDCGEDDIVVLEFDHVRGSKKYNVSKMLNNGGISWKRIKEEIDKC